MKKILILLVVALFSVSVAIAQTAKTDSKDEKGNTQQTTETDASKDTNTKEVKKDETKKKTKGFNMKGC